MIVKYYGHWDHSFKDAHALIHTQIQKIKNLEGYAQMFAANIWVVGLQ